MSNYAIEPELYPSNPLSEILTQHELWIESEGKGGKRANLTGASLTGADLTGASLYDASLYGANLTRANLTDANLTRANLTGANLTGADLARADLTDADLAQTCMFPLLLRGQRAFAKSRRSRGVILYRTSTSQHAGKTQYIPGRTYIANALSFDSATDCHPGIYGYTTLKELRKEYPGERYVRIYVRDGDWVWTAKGCPRCARVRILNYVD